MTETAPEGKVEPETARQPATRRILAAARELVARGGAAEISMGDVASRAGVSKALVHYHFRDKDSLLHALVEDVGFEVLARGRAAVAHVGATHALDDYWTWLSNELEIGDLNILTALADYDSDRVRAAARRIAAQRRDVAAQQIAQVFSRLSLTPRVPAELIAETALVFTDGLARSQALEPERDPRPAFDVLWLALLTLAD